MANNVVKPREFEDDDQPAQFPGTAVLFDPSVEEGFFVLYVSSVSPDTVNKIRDQVRDRKGRPDSAKFDELLVDRAVKGWTGLTPEAARACRLYRLSDAGVEKFRQALAADGQTEVPYSKEQARLFMRESLAFEQRVNELAVELEEIERAHEAYQGKASRTGGATGAGAAAAQGGPGKSS